MCKTVELLGHVKRKFIAADIWLPNSLDIKPVDYCIWRVMQEWPVCVESAIKHQQTRRGMSLPHANTGYGRR